MMALPAQASSTAGALFNQAALDYKDGRYLVAQLRFFEVLARDPARKQCEKYLLEIPRLQGMQMLKEHRYAEAEDYLRQSYNLQPGNEAIRRTLIELPFKIGKEQYEQGDCAAALTNFQRYEKVQPKDPLTHYYMANCLARTGYLDAATGEYLQSIRLSSPTSTTAAYAATAVQSIQKGRSAAVATATAGSSLSFGGLSPLSTPAVVPVAGIPALTASPSFQINIAGTTASLSGNVLSPGKAARKALHNPLHHAPNVNANALAPAPIPNSLAGITPASPIPPASLNPAANPGTLNPTIPNSISTTPTVVLPPVGLITPIADRTSSNPLIRQAVHSIRNQGTIDQANAEKVSLEWQRESAAQQAMDTAQINAAYNAQSGTKLNKTNTTNASSLTAQQQARLDAANNAAALKTFESQSWQATHSNLVNDAANNVQDLLTDPKSGLQAVGTDLYTRYYGGEPGKQVPEAHASFARIKANGFGQKYPEFTTDDDVLTMRKAPKRDVTGQLLP